MYSITTLGLAYTKIMKKWSLCAEHFRVDCSVNLFYECSAGFALVVIKGSADCKLDLTSNPQLVCEHNKVLLSVHFTCEDGVYIRFYKHISKNNLFHKGQQEGRQHSWKICWVGSTLTDMDDWSGTLQFGDSTLKWFF